MSPYTGSKINVNYERIASCVVCRYWTPGPTVLGIPAARYCVERRNHSAMTHLSKTYWHKPYGFRHPAKQWPRLLAGIILHSLGGVHLTLACIYIYMYVYIYICIYIYINVSAKCTTLGYRQKMFPNDNFVLFQTCMHIFQSKISLNWPI